MARSDQPFRTVSTDQLKAAQELAAKVSASRPELYAEEEERARETAEEVEAPAVDVQEEAAKADAVVEQELGVLTSPGSSDSPLASIMDVNEFRGEQEIKALCDEVRKRGNRVRVLLHPSTDPNDNGPFRGSVNGRHLEIPRGQTAVIDSSFLEVLYRAEIRGDYMAIDPQGRHVVESQRMKRFPFTILDPGYAQLGAHMMRRAM